MKKQTALAAFLAATISISSAFAAGEQQIPSSQQGTIDGKGRFAFCMAAKDSTPEDPKYLSLGFFAPAYTSVSEEARGQLHQRLKSIAETAKLYTVREFTGEDPSDMKPVISRMLKTEAKRHAVVYIGFGAPPVLSDCPVIGPDPAAKGITASLQ